MTFVAPVIPTAVLKSVKTLLEDELVFSCALHHIHYELKIEEVLLMGLNPLTHVLPFVLLDMMQST